MNSTVFSMKNVPGTFRIFLPGTFDPHPSNTWYVFKTRYVLDFRARVPVLEYSNPVPPVRFSYGLYSFPVTTVRFEYSCPVRFGSWGTWYVLTPSPPDLVRFR